MGPGQSRARIAVGARGADVPIRRVSCIGRAIGIDAGLAYIKGRSLGCAPLRPSWSGDRKRCKENSASPPGTSKPTRPYFRRSSKPTSQLVFDSANHAQFAEYSFTLAVYSFKFAVISFFDTWAHAPQLEALGLCWTMSARGNFPRHRRVDPCFLLNQHLKNGCSASEARQAVGGGREAVVTGTNLAEAIHRLALWVGGLSTGNAVRTLCPGLSANTGTGARLRHPPRKQSPKWYE